METTALDVFLLPKFIISYGLPSKPLSFTVIISFSPGSTHSSDVNGAAIPPLLTAPCSCWVGMTLGSRVIRLIPTRPHLTTMIMPRGLIGRCGVGIRGRMVLTHIWKFCTSIRACHWRNISYVRGNSVISPRFCQEP